MKFLKRIALFLLVNIAVILLLTTVASVFKIDLYYLKPYGLDLTALMIFSAIIGFAGSFISLLLSKQMAKWMMKVKVFTEAHDAHERKLIDVVSRIAAQLEIKMPEVGIYSSPEVNAFATGRSRNHSLVAVSSGLLQELNEDELEGVLAHEMAHIANGDMVTMTLLQGVINTFVIFLSRVVAYAVMNALGKGGRDMGYFMYYIVSIVFQIIFGMIASTIVFAFSRRREFRADRGGAEFVGKAKMIAALKKLSTLTNRVDTKQAALATMKISDKRGRFGKIFSTHPPMEERIARLEQLRQN
jgi:heat shock protein HtpX